MFRKGVGKIDNQKIYIMLSDTQSFISKGIKVYTKKPYSHVSIALDINLDEVYSFGRLRPHNPLIGGFVREDVDNGTFKIYPKTKVALYSIDVTLQQLNEVKAAIDKFKDSDYKYRYNFIGVVGVILNKPINRKYRYFCSQFVAEVLLDSDIKIIDKDIGLTLPDDFINHKELELVYEGKLQQYKRDGFKPSSSYI